jgi:hypothetical protein
MYGSVARGSYTRKSDLDLLIAPVRGVETRPDVRRQIAALPQSELLSITTYSWPELAAMAAYGSLFLVHLRDEGQLLYAEGRGDALRDLVKALPEYQLVSRDLGAFSMTLEDVAESLQTGGDPVYELGVVATVVRHCSILVTYLMGEPAFDRAESITRAMTHLGMAESIADAESLHNYRLARSRRVAPQSTTIELAHSRNEMAMRFVQEVIGRYEPAATRAAQD